MNEYHPASFVEVACRVGVKLEVLSGPASASARGLALPGRRTFPEGKTYEVGSEQFLREMGL